MTHNTIKTLLASTALVAAASASHAQQSFDVDFAYTGLAYSYWEGNGFPSDAYEGTIHTLDAAVGLNFGSYGRLILSGYNRGWDVDTSSFGGHIGPATIVSASYLYDLSEQITVGAFGAIGTSDTGFGGQVAMNALGLTGIYEFDFGLSVHGQIAMTDGEGENGQYGGLMDGFAARVGAQYALADHTVLHTDYEWGESQDYEDNGEDGEFWRFSLGGETLLTEWINMPIAATYEISQFSSVARNDSDFVDATEVSLGVRYYFGGTTQPARRSGDIGVPRYMLDAGSVNSLHD